MKKNEDITEVEVKPGEVFYITVWRLEGKLLLSEPFSSLKDAQELLRDDVDSKIVKFILDGDTLFGKKK